MRAIIVGAIGAAILVSQPASAAVTIDITQTIEGLAVVAIGSFDRSLANASSSYPAFGQSIMPAFGYVGVGEQGAVDSFSLVGPVGFGTGVRYVQIEDNIGLGVGLDSIAGFFFISSDYIDGTVFQSGGTAYGETLASAGLVEGTYQYAIGGESLTVTIGQGAPAVPEPAIWSFMIAGFGLVGGAMRRRVARVTYD